MLCEICGRGLRKLAQAVRLEGTCWTGRTCIVIRSTARADGDARHSLYTGTSARINTSHNTTLSQFAVISSLHEPST